MIHYQQKDLIVKSLFDCGTCGEIFTGEYNIPPLPALRLSSEQMDVLDLSHQIYQEYTVLPTNLRRDIYFAPQDFWAALATTKSITKFDLINEMEQDLVETFIIEDKSEVFQFMQQHPYLHSVLFEAKEEIIKYFSDSELILEVMIDPESDEDNEELVLSILTDLEVRESLLRLDEFDRNWWDKNIRRAKGNLCITVDYK